MNVHGWFRSEPLLVKFVELYGSSMSSLHGLASATDVSAHGWAPADVAKTAMDVYEEFFPFLRYEIITYRNFTHIGTQVAANAENEFFEK